MAQIAAAGVDEVIVSWWGRGSARTPVAARRRDGAAPRASRRHPHRAVPGPLGCTVAPDLGYLATFGVRDVFVYRPREIAREDWAGARTGALDDADLRRHASWSASPPRGASTASTPTTSSDYSGAKFARLCAQAHAAASRSARRASARATTAGAPASRRTRPRQNGATYDLLWTRGAGRDIPTS